MMAPPNPLSPPPPRPPAVEQAGSGAVATAALRRYGAAALVAALALPAPAVLAHELQHTVAPAQALVVELRYADGSPFAFEAYEVHRDGDKIPYQVGRTDAAGRIAFLADGPATWRVRAFSEDGHGLDVRVESTDAGAVETGGQSVFDRFSRIVIGVGVILGLFGILKLFVRRRPA